MNQFYKKINLLLILGILLISSCSKEETEENPIVTETESIFKSQLVTVHLPEINLSKNEYQGMLDGVSVNLIKSLDNKLLFLLPYSTTLGQHTLTIPALNKTLTYDVKDTVLSETPEETMVSFFANLDSFSQTLDTSPEAASIKNSLNVFKASYAKATVEEKKELAVLYKANKAQFDEIFLYDFTNTTGKTFFFEKAKLAVAKHGKAVLLMASGVAMVTVGSPIVIGVGIIYASAGAYKAYKANEEAIDNLVATIGTEVGGFLGISNKKLNPDTLTFDDDIANQFSFNVMQRNIIESDKSKTEPLAKEYFESYDMYNYYANKENIEIQNFNKNNATNYSLIPLEVLPTTSPEVKTIVNAEIFKNIQFTITDPNLTLVSVTLEKDGQLNMQIKLTENSTSFSIDSFLNYTYTDEFSSFSGKLPITVNRSLIGTWKLESYDGTPVGETQYETNSCGEILNDLTIFEETYIFQKDSYILSRKLRYVDYNKFVIDCSVIEDGIDTEELVIETRDGGYIFKDGTVYFLDSNDPDLDFEVILDSINAGLDDDLDAEEVIFISGNIIDIDGYIYVRQ